MVFGIFNELFISILARTYSQIFSFQFNLDSSLLSLLLLLLVVFLIDKVVFLSYRNFLVFGVGLCRLSTGGDPAAAPSVVSRLVQEIEQRAAATPSLDLYRLYQTTTPSAETLAQLCQHLSTDPGRFSRNNRRVSAFRFFSVASV